ncbi:TrkH family potassium uptake protein [Terribacillus saccharophilus]|jgi:trk system potassium uptake protein|uniref:Ktr system potassium transporter B n=1 Tax=Terribacillus saccharophilus TaxID=361277 RepID=A0ABX4GV43_9BACI|nr:TrkH family potassium uptake protein [Terribacillus saccharophilus]PAD34403.1 Ktr system potassium transporter B [Terribacillus saccharophilus]PAD95277.1 Ktr system potassium transporter B [Terribacillus saccharophilus]PAD98730.1 Ktr system potassium transporter B [Terribacillus saccharophilus]
MATRGGKLFHRIKINPPQFFALGFLLLIALGTILLMLPIATADRHHLSFIDALFEATSAVCVTGLVVVDTQTTFTLFGQIVLLCLIQVGGLGFMTLTVFIALLLRRNISFEERHLVKESLNQDSYQGIVTMVRFVLLFTIICEVIGTIILGIHWGDEFGYPKSFYYGLFHSISAFNNAGFDIMGDFSSMTAYVDDPIVNLTLTSLLLLGGIGFIVVADIFQKRKTRKRLTLHTKVVLWMSAVLVVSGTLLIFLLEYGNPATIGNLSWNDKLLASYFHGVVPRTAGFNSLNTADLTLGSQLVTMALMFIGGGTGGTAGGIKVTTFAILLFAVWALIKGKQEVNIRNRRIPGDLVFRAFSITTYSVLLVSLFVFLLAITEKGAALNYIAFEVLSAFGTVGMSLGLTPDLSESGKILLSILMFMGRVGPITIAFALAFRIRKTAVRNPEERIIIG